MLEQALEMDLDLSQLHGSAKAPREEQPGTPTCAFFMSYWVIFWDNILGWKFIPLVCWLKQSVREEQISCKNFKSCLMWLACQKKSYLICDEITNFRIFMQPIPNLPNFVTYQITFPLTCQPQKSQTLWFFLTKWNQGGKRIYQGNKLSYLNPSLVIYFQKLNFLFFLGEMML